MENNNEKLNNKQMETFDIKKHGCRELHEMDELVKLMARNRIVWCWGAKGWTRYPNNKALRFRVSGMLHKGFVFLTVNGSDLFDIHLTNLKGKIKKSITDVFVGDLINTIDSHVEREQN